MKMDKKGVDITLNTIIIAILVVLVLVVIAAFFLVGISKITDTIKVTLFRTTTGSSPALAVSNCELYCDRTNMLPTEKLKEKGVYCMSTQFVDMNNDGEADKVESGDKEGEFIKFYCYDRGDKKEDEQSLSVDCIDDKKGEKMSNICLKDKDTQSTTSKPLTPETGSNE